ncbi:MAG: hypothetical protein NVSMB6_17070 [Burkholderiaceae bacterium]
MEQAVAALRKAGATVVEIDDPTFATSSLNETLDVQKWEFKTLFNAYLHSFVGRSASQIRDRCTGNRKIPQAVSRKILDC